MSWSRSHEKALAVFERDLRATNRAEATCVLLLRTARSFLTHATKPVRKLELDDVRNYLAARVEEGVSSSTHAGEIYHLRAFFRSLVETKLVAASPMDEVEARPATHGVRLLLSEEAVARLLTAALEPARVNAISRAICLRDRACLELLYGLGLRRSEVCAARVGDLSVAEGTLLVRRAKRGRPRFLPVTKSALEAIGLYLRESRPLLSRRGRGQDAGFLLLTREGGPLSGQVVLLLVARIARRAGLRAHPHAFRRAVATHLVRAGAPVPVVQELLGHARLSTTAAYVAVDHEDLRRAVALLENAK